VKDRFVLPNGLITQPDLKAAVQRQCDSRPDLLPPDPADAAVLAVERTNAVAKHTNAAAVEGLVVPSRSAIAAHKARYATRPVLALSLPERALLEALLTKLREQINDLDLTEDPTSVSYKDLQQRPIETEAPWVVGADVNSYFQYVNHQMLVDQLVARTGEWGLANAIRDILGGLMGRASGLPQGFRPMRLLGDVYLSQCVRALRRSGYDAWAHSDDLRIACKSRRHAHESVVVLDEALRDAGLSLNTEKCWMRPQSQYAEWSARPQRLLDEFAELHDVVSLWELAGPYDEENADEDDEEPSEDDIRGTVRLIFDWVAEKDQSTGGAAGWSDRIVITEALRKGTSYPEPHGVAMLPRILDEFPQLTDEVAQYLRAVSAIDEDAANTAVHEMCAPRRPLSAWQLAWLSWASLEVESVSRRMLARCHAIHASMSLDAPWSWCSALLLRVEELEPDDLAAVLGRVESAVARDVVIEALASSELEVKESLAEFAHERAIIAAVRS
jgi:hypothetical protein